MTSFHREPERAPIRVVLADANVLYSRVLRDYLLYAADAELISIRWSAAILAEVIEHLTKNLSGFDAASGRRLIAAMSSAFPGAEVASDEASRRAVAAIPLPDEDDRHVLEAAIAAEADIICTDNTKDFPPTELAAIGIEALTADALLSLLIEEFPGEMTSVHATVVSRLTGATDASMLAKLRRAGAVSGARLLSELVQ
ncbi:PIN domain-containing protein [Agromyces archimandritae]|uniref:PIN domain-containing protein n=1 Tax=Agromyces archimandritae TaxID=2781962 RepID=A0A975FKK3_9MICO|nr:PIN domain-containing protein [Agromyces archimandritae]QTX03566.1 PIN domain-containing protein [Agromyces archimandritae]